jgi:hypothetical protein
MTLTIPKNFWQKFWVIGYNSREFWSNVSKYPQILINIIRNVGSYIINVKSPNFWENVSKNDDILEVLTEISKENLNNKNNIWRQLITSTTNKPDISRFPGFDSECVIFWQNIAQNENVVSQLFEIGLFTYIISNLDNNNKEIFDEFKDFWKNLIKNKAFLSKLQEEDPPSLNKKIVQLILQKVKDYDLNID